MARKCTTPFSTRSEWLKTPSVSLPVMINVDGFNLTHVIEPIEFWTKDMVKEYLPPFKPLNTLHPNKVVSMGAFGMPEIYTEQKYAHDHVLLKSHEVMLRGWDEMAKLTGRKYSPVETYKADDAEILLFGMGSICETASIAVDQMREQGKSVGLVKLRLWRPLPKNELKSILGKAKEVVVLDRSLAPGAANAPVTSEMRALMYHEAQRPKIHCMIAGLGGRDVTPQDVVNMVEQAIVEKDDDYHFYGVRG